MEGLADYLVQQYCDITAREIVKAMSLSLQKKARKDATQVTSAVVAQCLLLVPDCS